MKLFQVKEVGQNGSNRNIFGGLLNKLDTFRNDLSDLLTSSNIENQKKIARLKLLEFFSLMQLEGIDILKGTTLNGKSHELLNKLIQIIEANGLEHISTEPKKYTKNRYFESIFEVGEEDKDINYFEITEIIEPKEQRLIQIGIKGKDKFTNLNLEIIFLITKVAGKDDVSKLKNEPFKKFLDAQFGGLEQVDKEGALYINKRNIDGYNENVHRRKYIFLYEDKVNSCDVYVANKEDDDINSYHNNVKIQVI